MLARTLTVVVTGLVISLPAPAVAQRSYALGIAGGAAIPVGKLATTEKNGGNGTIVLAMGSPDLPIGIRLDGLYNHFARKDVTFPAGTAGSVYSQRIIAGALNLVGVFPGTVAKPYLIAGVGYYNTKALLSAAKADNHVGFNGGAGLTFGLGPIGSFLEVRYHSISRSVATGGVIHFVPITFGILL